MTQHEIISRKTSILDRPIWNSLNSNFGHLAESSGTALALPRKMSPFAASEGFAPYQIQDFLLLIARRKEPVMTIEVETPTCPRLCKAENPIVGVQMIAKHTPPPRNTLVVCDLNNAHSRQIVELAGVCQPGPFRSKTQRLGNFIGVIQEGELIAMVGQRLRLPGFIEISALCVEPKYRGCGVGAELVRCMSKRILDSGNTPFLHAYASNKSAIALYEHLGFETRCYVQATDWIQNVTHLKG